MCDISNLNFLEVISLKKLILSLVTTGALMVECSNDENQTYTEEMDLDTLEASSEIVHFDGAGELMTEPGQLLFEEYDEKYQDNLSEQAEEVKSLLFELRDINMAQYGDEEVDVNENRTFHDVHVELNALVKELREENDLHN